MLTFMTLVIVKLEQFFSSITQFYNNLKYLYLLKVDIEVMLAAIIYTHEYLELKANRFVFILFYQLEYGRK